MLDIGNVSNLKLKSSGTIIIRLRVGDSCTRVNVGVINNFVVLIVLETTYIDRFIKFIPPIER